MAIRKNGFRKGPSIGRSLRIESLEDRRLLASDAFAALVGAEPAIAVIGDSLSDEYSDKSYSYARNWVELLAAEKGANFGPLGDWGTSRGDGYEYNWARPGASTQSAIEGGQLDGVIDQVAAGEVTHVLAAIGSNDFSVSSSAFASLYGGLWSTTESLAFRDSVVANVDEIVETLKASGASVVVSTLFDPSESPRAIEDYPDADGRARVSAAIDQVNSRLRVLASLHQVPLVDPARFYDDLAAGDPESTVAGFEIGGVAITNAGGIGVQNSFVDDGVHIHTVSQALLANLYAEAFTSGYGLPIEQFTEQQITGLVGLDDSGADTLPLAYSRYVYLPEAIDNEGPIVRSLASQLVVAPVFGVQVDAEICDCGTGGRGVLEAEYFIDSLGAPGLGEPLLALDGRLDGTRESAGAMIDPATFASLADGEHTILVRGRDSAGNWGPVSTTTFTKTAQFYLSFATSAGLVSSDGATVDVDQQDVVRLTLLPNGGRRYDLYFDGSDVGLDTTAEDIDAVHVQADGSLVISTRRPGLASRFYGAPSEGSGEDIQWESQDLMLFTPFTTGPNTTGAWSRLLDGAASGLESDSENIDAVSLLADGTIVISTVGVYSVGGLSGSDKDLIAYSPGSGSWSLFVNGADFDRSTTGEDIDGVSVTEYGGRFAIHLSALGDFEHPEVAGSRSDVATLYIDGSGPTAVGAYGSVLLLDDQELGFAGPQVDALHVAPPRSTTRPNIVLINTDDQRDDSLVFMPQVMAELVANGTRFDNSFATTPVCCPSRASLLTGQYAHNNGVVHNETPLGGFQNFDDTSTIATWLDAAGYRTAMFGKYMNGYDRNAEALSDAENLYIPPGWDVWQSFVGASYFNYHFNNNGIANKYGKDPEDYSTDVLAEMVDSFFRDAEANDDEPFFVYFAPKNPHVPVAPAPRHVGTLDGIEPHRPPSFNEADISDKPEWVVSNLPLLDAAGIAEIDAFRQGSIESMLSVDEAVGRFMDTLRELGELDNTIVIYTSDNGNLWGEHRFDKKGPPWEESIRVPLIVYDGREPRQQSIDSMALNIDVAVTIAELAGLPLPTEADGRSLVPLINGANSTDSVWREDFVIESYGGIGRPYVALRTTEWMYAEYGAGDIELYDLINDPYQLESKHNDPSLAGLRSHFSARIREILGPDTTGPVVTDVQVAIGRLGDPVTITAVVSDLNTGANEVRSPEIFLDRIGQDGKGLGMLPVDGVYDSFRESVSVTVPYEAWRTISEGEHTFYIHGQDVRNNWGSYVSGVFTKTQFTPAPTQVAAYYLAFEDATTLIDSSGGELAYQPNNIVKLVIDGAGGFTFEKFFDGSDVGLTTGDDSIAAFHRTPDGDLLIVPERAASVAAEYASPGVATGVTVEASGNDILRFRPTSLGEDTAGEWSVWFEGGSFGLDTLQERIDALHVLSDGRIVISTIGSTTVPGQVVVDDDLLAYDPQTGRWSVYLRGLDIDLGSEDIDALFIEEQTDGLPFVHLSDRVAVITDDVTASREDVVRLNPYQLGYRTIGAFDPRPTLVGGAYGLPNISALSFEKAATVLYRVNAGGADLAGAPGWEQDTKGNPSPYTARAGLGTNAYPSPVVIDATHPSLSAEVPDELFRSGRYGQPGGDDMSYSFSVAPGLYEVRLLFAETLLLGQGVGNRVFDVRIEGATVLASYDIFADVGGYAGVAKTFSVATVDGAIDISFVGRVQNPVVRGIEILSQQTSMPVVSQIAPENSNQSTFLPGDYNFDNVVDAADYTAWRDALGQSGPTLGGPNEDGESASDGYEVWRDNFGASLPSSLTASATAGDAYIPSAAESATQNNANSTAYLGSPTVIGAGVGTFFAEWGAPSGESGTSVVAELKSAAISVTDELLLLLALEPFGSDDEFESTLWSIDDETPLGDLSTSTEEGRALAFDEAIGATGFTAACW